MAISLDKLTSLHHRAVTVRQDRMELLAGNLANQNTPGYKSRDINFQEAMKTASYNQRMHLNRTADAHIKGQMQSDRAVEFRIPTQPDTGDGNTVEAQIERNAFLDNGMRYQASLQFLGGKFKSMKKAITGGQA